MNKLPSRWMFGALVALMGCEGSSGGDASRRDAGDGAVGVSDASGDVGRGGDGSPGATDASGGERDGGATGAPDASGGDRDGSVRPPLRVLFVGNSYTAYNELPVLVSAIISATVGGDVEVSTVLRGGATLANHWNDTGARERIATWGAGVVVFQGQSLEAVVNPTDFQAHAELFSGALTEAGARGVWYATWARRDIEADPAQIWAAIDDEYRRAAMRNGDRLARVGAAWEIARLAWPEVQLFAADRSHPSPAGSLLAACVIAEAITGVAPVLPDEIALGLPREVAQGLCALAARGVPCDPLESECDGVCVAWSPQQCGGCDVRCAPEEPCRAGVCGCDSGLIACSGQCVRQGSAAHCGGCGDACALGQSCDEGVCVCPDVAPINIHDRFDELNAHAAGCERFDGAGSLACNTAAHRFCAGSACFASGFIASGHAPNPYTAMCLPGEVRETSFAELGALEASCDAAASVSQACATAIHRLCAADAISGYGPIEVEGDTVRVVCLAAAGIAEIVRVSAEVLATHISRCIPDAATCSAAAWNYCQERGFRAGFGPVELAGDDREVVCIP